MRGDSHVGEICHTLMPIEEAKATDLRKERVVASPRPFNYLICGSCSGESAQ